MVENLISSGIEDHTFGPMNLREHAKCGTMCLLGASGVTTGFSQGEKT